MPDLNIGISEVLLPNGTSQYVRRSQTNYSGELSIRQPIRWTGGNVFINSGLSRLDLMGDNGTTSYRSSPFYFGYQQPLFKFNSFKWESKIEPLAFEGLFIYFAGHYQQDISGRRIFQVVLQSLAAFFAGLAAGVSSYDLKHWPVSFTLSVLAVR